MDELILRSARGQCSAPEEAIVAKWRRQAAENEAAYQDLLRLVRASRRLEAANPVGEPPPVTDLIRRAERLAPSPADRFDNPRRARFRGLRRSLAIAALAASGFIGFAVGRWRHGGPRFFFGGTEFITGKSEVATVRLADGSVVRLAPGSRLRVSGTSQRDAWLEGRGYFAVAKMEGRPFRVRTRVGNAQVLGTRFDLSVADTGLRLVVVEGRVALSAEGKEVDVIAGEISQVVKGSSVSVTKVDDVLPLVDWKKGFLAFQSTPLQDAAREIERQYGVHVSIADSLLAKQTVSVWFEDRSVAEVARIICLVVNARCWMDGTTLRVAR